MPYGLLLVFATLFIPAKLMGLRLPFYSAALLAVAGLYVIESISNGYQFGPIATQDNGIRLLAAAILFFLLDKSEDKTGRWIIIFLITFAVFAFVL
jgi:hypothetical protein